MNFLKKLANFIREVANDERIPSKDKKIILVLLALIVSPIDFIPDWIPIIGILDDFILIAIILDYFFDVLDDEILLSHYPWGMKSFLRIKRFAKIISRFSPAFIKNRIWDFEGSPYKH